MIKILKLVLYLFCLYIIIEQLIRLTYSTILYNYNYNYGKNLSKLCKYSKTEINSMRYNLYNNYKKYYIKHSLKNKENDKNIYNEYILISSIIFTIFISAIFSLILYNNFIKFDKNFNYYNIKVKIYIVILILLNICFFIYPILVIIFEYIKNTKITKYRINIFKQNEINENLVSTKVNYSIYIYISLISILFILQFYSYHYKINLPDFEKNYNTNNNVYKLILFILYSCIYTFTIYYISNIISILKNKKNEKQKNYIENNYYKINYNDNLILIYLHKIFGFKEHNNYQDTYYKKNLFNDDIKIKTNAFYRKNISGLIFIFIIFIISILILYNIIYYYYYYDNDIIIFLKNIKNFIILPFIFITIILVILNSTLQYNTIYNNLIKEIYNIYEQDLNIINKDFSDFLDTNENFKIFNNIKLGLYNLIYKNLFESFTPNNYFKILYYDYNKIDNFVINFTLNNCNEYNYEFTINENIFRINESSPPSDCKNNTDLYKINYKNLEILNKNLIDNDKIKIPEKDKKTILSKYNQEINNYKKDDEDYEDYENIFENVSVYIYNYILKKFTKDPIENLITKIEKRMFSIIKNIFLFENENASTISNKMFLNHNEVLLETDIDLTNISKISCYNIKENDADLENKKNNLKIKLKNVISKIKYEYKILIVKNLLLKILAENKINNEYNKKFTNEGKIDFDILVKFKQLKAAVAQAAAEAGATAAQTTFNTFKSTIIDIKIYEIEFNNKIINEYEIDLLNNIKLFLKKIDKIIKEKKKTKEEEDLLNNYKIINDKEGIFLKEIYDNLNIKKCSYLNQKLNSISVRNPILTDEKCNINDINNDIYIGNYLIYILLFIYILIILIIKYIN